MISNAVDNIMDDMEDEGEEGGRILKQVPDKVDIHFL